MKVRKSRKLEDDISKFILMLDSKLRLERALLFGSTAKGSRLAEGE